jgi:hypothetical protein
MRDKSLMTMRVSDRPSRIILLFVATMQFDLAWGRIFGVIYRSHQDEKLPARQQCDKLVRDVFDGNRPIGEWDSAPAQRSGLANEYHTETLHFDRDACSAAP